MEFSVGGQMMKFYLHPVFVHFPIALFFLEAMLLFMAIVKREAPYASFARFSFWLGFGFMLITAGAGILDAGGPDEIRGAVRRHFLAAVSVIAVYLVKAGFWLRVREPAVTDLKRQFYLSLAGYLLITYTGWLGGKLVYSYVE